MRYQSIALSILLVLFALMRALYALMVVDATNAAETGHPGSASTDPESRLARGEKLPFGCLDLADLELIPGVSETLGNNMLRYRSKVMIAHRASRDHTALTEVPGIGEKRSRELYSYLDLASTQCPTARDTSGNPG